MIFLFLCYVVNKVLCLLTGKVLLNLRKMLTNKFLIEIELFIKFNVQLNLNG